VVIAVMLIMEMVSIRVMILLKMVIAGGGNDAGEVGSGNDGGDVNGNDDDGDIG